MIYRLRYCNKDGVEARVDIQKGSSTPVIEVEGTERPFILSYNNDKGDKSGMFLSSSADIEIYETTDLDLDLNFNIDNLKTSNETELSVTHYIDNVVSWQGFIIPDFFSIEVRSNPVIAMTASDRIGTLKSVTLSNLPSMITNRELCVQCLGKTGLNLPLKTLADFHNGVDDFFNSKVLSQRLTDLKGRSISCYDILGSILTQTNSKLLQRDGAWHIINKYQHELGSGKLYSSATSYTDWTDSIHNFNELTKGARRLIVPVASSVGVYHEHGGGKTYPENSDFSQGLSGWTTYNDFDCEINNNEVLRYIQDFTYWRPSLGGVTEKNNLRCNRNPFNPNAGNNPYVESPPIVVTYPDSNSVEVTIDINAISTGAFIAATSYINFAVIAKAPDNSLYSLGGSGSFTSFSGNPYFHRERVVAEASGAATTVFKGVKGVLTIDDDSLEGYNFYVRIYGSGGAFTPFINSVSASFMQPSDNPKGLIYKTEQGVNFTKTHEIETTIFGDFMTGGLNGYFYPYPIDDTSSLYNSNNELTSKWSAPNDNEELPLLQHTVRQKARMFSVAHDVLRGELEISNFDPLFIFKDCNNTRYSLISGKFDFLNSSAEVEIEEIKYLNINRRDFIYSYFGDGESGIKSIGGISGAGSGGTGGGLTPEQLEILSFWKKDPDNPNTIFTEMNAYSKLELSAYGAGDGGGGGGGGSDYERLDTWASYDSSRAGWVLSAFLGNDLNTRVTAIDGRVTDLENSAGSGSVTSVGISVPTGLSVSNSPITSSGVIAIGLQTGYSIPTTAKQGQWDTAYGWGSHAGKYVRLAGNDNINGVKTFNDTIKLFATGTARKDVLTAGNSEWFQISYSGGYAGLDWFSKLDNGTRINTHPSLRAVSLAYASNTLQIRVGATTGVGNESLQSNYNIWHSGDFTQAEVSNWNTAFTNNHTHANKTQLDLITQSNIDVLARLSIVNGNLQINGNAYATGELSAYGVGTGGGGGGGLIDTVYGYSNLGQTFNNSILTDTFNAYTVNQINTRLVAVEAGSATTINTTGTGNAITSITKSGTVITANKDLTFSLAGHSHTISDITNLQTTLNNKLETSIFNTHNNDNVRHITGAERTKWDTVVTDFAGLEIGGRNLIANTSSEETVLGGFPASGFSEGIIGYTINPATKDYYVLSFDAKSTVTGDLIDCHFYQPNTTISALSSTGVISSAVDGRVRINITDNWQRYWIKYTQDGAATTTIKRWLVGRRISGAGTGIISVRSIKLEKGTIPTDWTPAPEDQVSDWNTTDVNSFSFIKNKPTKLSDFTDNIGIGAHIANNVIHITSAERTNWNDANTKKHTHPNKAIIDQLTQADINVLAKLSLVDGNLKVDTNLYSTGEVSAYGVGSGGGSGGGDISMMQDWTTSPITENYYLPAKLAVPFYNDTRSRLTTLEGGSATTVNVSGTGDLLASVSKAGNNINFTKGNQTWANLSGKPATFAPSAHTHNASDINAGVLGIARIPTGTTSSTVALGNHTHTFASLTSKPTTISGYGITDATSLSIFNTHNNDNVRHITGAERTKWDAVVTDFAGLEIGGRNYAIGFGEERVVSTGTSSHFGVIPVKPNDYVTVSFYVKGSDSFSGNLFIHQFHSVENPVGTSDRVDYQWLIATIGTEYTYHEETIKVPDNSSIVSYTLGQRTPAGIVVTVYNVKLEKGNKPTDWSPAPEDQVSDWSTTDVNSLSFIKNKPTSLSQFTDNIGVATHIANTSNPHSVTKAQVGLGNVDNTSDLNKPISTATQTALNLKANLASPTFTGTVTAPTFIGALNGNATTATTLATARTLTVGNTGKTFNGSANVSWSLTEIGAADRTQSILAGNGLTGGGTLAADRTITLGTPGNITLSSTNSVTTASHTHNLTLGGTASQYLNGATTLVTIPTVTAGNGLTGGGQLTSGITLTLATPGTLTAATNNGVTASSHTHAITTTSVGAANTIIQTDATGGTKLNNLIVGGDWKLEQVGTELQLKYNDVVAQRFLLDGSIVGLGEITAYGEATGGEGVALLRTGGTMTGNLTMSADIIMNSGRAIGVSNLPLKLLGNALTYNASNILTEANTATQIKMGNGWTIEQTTSALTIKKNGVVKGTFNA